MALTTNAVSKFYGSTVNHIVNGAQITSTSFSTSADVDTAFTNTDAYLWCDVVLTLTKASAGTAGLTVALYKRPLNLVSTTDQNEPDATFKTDLVAVKVVDNVATEQLLLFENIWLGGRSVEFYVENLTGVTINNTWDLDIWPFTFGPA